MTTNHDPSSTASSNNTTSGKSLDSEEPPPIDDRGGCRKFFSTVLEKLGMLLACVFLAGLGLGLGWYSFTDIEKMRQLERTPEIPNASIITGEVNLSGTVAKDQELLRSPKTNTESVYYRYTIEERRRDSDGNTRWETVHSSSDRVDFILMDSTGGVLISATDAGVDIDAPRSFRERDGSRRYTEYRIDPRDQVFIFGYAQETSDGYQVGFREPGNYYPIISAGTEHEQRHSRAITSGIMIALGVGALLFSVFFLLRLLRIHHSALYLSMATVVVIVALSFQSFSMMVSDLQSADESAGHTLEEGERVINEVLERNGVDPPDTFEELGSFDDAEYSELSDDELQRASGVRMTMARSVQRTNDNLSRFPEMLVGPMIGIHPLDPIDVPEEEQAQIEEMEADYSPVRLGVHYGLGAILVGILGLIFGTKAGLGKIGVKRTIENVPTSPTDGAVYGLTELKGKAERVDFKPCYTSPLSHINCVYYRYKVERKKRSGKKTKWVTIRDETKVMPFYCRDHAGRMLVKPEGAECIAARRIHERKGKRRYTEWTIAEYDDVYALGSATINPDDHEELVLTDEDEETPFIITSLSEGELMQRKAAAGFMHLNFGIVATMMAGMGLTGMVVTFGPMLYVATAAISCSYLFLVLVFLYYNDLVFLRERVQRNWSNIDVALKKRFDLIQNLAEIVQEYMAHERQLQKDVTEARTARHTAVTSSPDNAEVAAEERVRNQILATVEDYPELKSKEMVAKLMRALSNVENDIALMRQGYNDSVERYNTRIAHFPEVLVAYVAVFQKALHLHSTKSEAERRPVPVEGLGSPESKASSTDTQMPSKVES